MLHWHRKGGGSGVIADSLAFGAHADLLEGEELLELDLAILDTDDLGHAHDAADAAAQAGLLGDQMDGGADGLANGARRKGLAGPEDEGFPSDQALPRAVGVQGRTRALRAGGR